MNTQKLKINIIKVEIEIKKNDTNQKDEHVKDYYDYRFRLGSFYTPLSRRYQPIPLRFLLNI